jgi:hypothetical protein
MNARSVRGSGENLACPFSGDANSSTLNGFAGGTIGMRKN